jgi:hypothetical protein
MRMNKNGKRSIVVSVALAAAFAAPGAWAQHVGVGLGGAAGGHGQAGVQAGPVGVGGSMATPRAGVGANVDASTGMMAGQSIEAAQHAAHRAEMKARAEEKKARAEANKAASAAGNASDQAMAAVEGNATAGANAAVTSGADTLADQAADAGVDAGAGHGSDTTADGRKDRSDRKDAKNPKRRPEPAETSGD